MRFTTLTSHQGFKRAVVLLFAVCCLVTVIWGAQQQQSGSPSADILPGGERQTLRALLDEVHQLRLALQRANLTSTRAQLAFERMRLQRARLDTLLREVESVRSQLLSLREALAQTTDRIKETVEQIVQTPEAALRARLERQLTLSKQVLHSQTRREEQFRERETQLAAQVQIEQAKLGELEEQLGNLERELSAP
jgi:hypothetical protein